jgi:hypothetical protein
LLARAGDLRLAGPAQIIAGELPDFPPLPRSFDRSGLEQVGFVGWLTWDQLRASDFVRVPDAAAAYVVFQSAPSGPRFAATNPGGRFKGKDPSVSVDILADTWVAGCQAVYIGKADRHAVGLCNLLALAQASR